MHGMSREIHRDECDPSCNLEVAQSAIFNGNFWARCTGTSAIGVLVQHLVWQDVLHTFS